MNTQKSLPRMFRSIFGIIIALFMFSSCSKDELTPASLPVTTDNSIKTAAVNPLAMPYEVIKINHFPGRGLRPDYSVAVFSDLSVIFDGRGNTAFMGTKQFTINQKTFSMITGMFASSHLFDLPVDEVTNFNGGAADIPEVLTSYNDGTHTITLIDNNDPNSQPALVNLRMRTESFLGIYSLITDTSNQDRK